MQSGVHDSNGQEIKEGDKVQISVQAMTGKPVVSIQSVGFIRGAYRYMSEAGKINSCIGDLGHNCTTVVIGNEETS
jgi:hypothetical protein